MAATRLPQSITRFRSEPCLKPLTSVIQNNIWKSFGINYIVPQEHLASWFEALDRLKFE